MSTTPIDTSPYGVVAFDNDEDMTVYTFPILPGDNASYFRGVRDSTAAKESLQYIRDRPPASSKHQPSIQFTPHPQTIATITEKFLSLPRTPHASQVTLIEGQKSIGHTYSISKQCWAPRVLTYAGIIGQLGGLQHADDTLGLKVAIWAADRSIYEALTGGIESAMAPSPSWKKRLRLSSR